MLQDDNDEFVNFSDEENAVTLSLDAFSISSRNSASQGDPARPDENRDDVMNNNPIDDDQTSAYSEQNENIDIQNENFTKNTSFDDGVAHDTFTPDRSCSSGPDFILYEERSGATSNTTGYDDDELMSYESEDFELESVESDTSLPTPLEANAFVSEDVTGPEYLDIINDQSNDAIELPINASFENTSTHLDEITTVSNANSPVDSLDYEIIIARKSGSIQEQSKYYEKIDINNEVNFTMHNDPRLRRSETGDTYDINTERSMTTTTKDGQLQPGNQSTSNSKLLSKRDTINHNISRRRRLMSSKQSPSKMAPDYNRTSSDLPRINAQSEKDCTHKTTSSPGSHHPTDDRERSRRTMSRSEIAKRRNEKAQELRKIYKSLNTDKINSNLRVRKHKTSIELENKNQQTLQLPVSQSKTTNPSMKHHHLKTCNAKPDTNPIEPSNAPTFRERTRGNNDPPKTEKYTSSNNTPQAPGKIKRPNNINDLHMELSAINARAMAEHEKYARTKPNAEGSILPSSLGHTRTSGNNSARTDLRSCSSDQSDSKKSNGRLKDNTKTINKTDAHKHKHSDEALSQNSKNVLKIETDARCGPSRPIPSTSHEHKSNYDEDISRTRLLHEDYTSGNWNGNNRYGNEILSSTDNKQESFNSHTGFLKSQGINTITEQEKLLSNSFVQGVPRGKHTLAPLVPKIENTNGRVKNASRRNRRNKKRANAVSDDDESVLKMSGNLRQRNSSGLTDLARLQDIRRELLLTDTEVDDVFLTASVCKETVAFVQDIIKDILRKVCRHNSGYRPTELIANRCTTTDESGTEVLCCLLQAPRHKIDPNRFSCEVLDPLDVPRVTGKHERLISNIIRFKATDTGQLNAEKELVASVPVAQYMVAPWQEVVVKEIADDGTWTESGETADIIKIDDGGKPVHVVQLLLKALASVAIITRPKTDCAVLGDQCYTVTSSADPGVKMRMPAIIDATGGAAYVRLQVVPVDEAMLTAFRQSRYHNPDVDVTAASSLIVMTMTRHTPETVTFFARCVKARRDDIKLLDVDRRPSVRYVDTSTSRDLNTPTPRDQSTTSPRDLHTPRDQSTTTPRDLNTLLTPRTKDYVPISRAMLQARSVLAIARLSVSSTHRMSSESDKRRVRDMHLVQMHEDSEVRLKLLDDGDTTDTPGRDSVARFSVYDRQARLLAMETKSGLQYNKIQKLAQSFTDFVVKHNVTLKVGQDIRNVYSVRFSMTICIPCKQDDKTWKKITICPNQLTTTLQIDDGDLVGVVFRGNIDVTNQTQRVYSFHGYRGINKNFDIKVGDAFSQRSLQNFHGGIKIFTLKGPRLGVADRMEVPTPGAGWELRAEFPLVLPKYMKKAPVLINKAPVSLRFTEPLTVDFLNKICTDLVDQWNQFSRALGVSHARLQSIKQNNRNVVSERMLMDVVVCWMKQQPVSRDKVPPILQALTKCGKWKLVSELTQRNDSLSNHRSLSAKERQLQKAFALICQSKHVTCKWQQLFRHLFCEEKTEEQLRDLVAAIEARNENEVSRCHRALCLWKAETTVAPSLWKLVDALRYCHCDVVADSLTDVEAKRP